MGPELWSEGVSELWRRMLTPDAILFGVLGALLMVKYRSWRLSLVLYVELALVCAALRALLEVW